MKDPQEAEAFYQRLHDELEKSTTWPSQYLYKFIVKSEEGKMEAIEKLFDNTGAVIRKKASSGGKYTSVSINVVMDSPEAVILKYKEVGKIKGVISL
ncbi:DUF493 family protein [Robertkochia sediminum]|uniref:DUF493 family protein n=1 Tax=Robertkochia sediminum TaxID=2785326 RepID=UPI0019328F5A|nr:DUF493 family protein [Robertkochia sediminum]MBL7474168.1 DUF493 domain-containing protein [Robertkochia sediminum]